ncbi:uncharacterized protein BP5553_05683 [Venustampulla echinocandica]|uniref:Uncharacterized protein n=1 Tax=Venustampulla echinocandica TaxID=2656787 RepID=A0A370TLD2_9HELO|nr:uncharacterized protein BP5553_05683 [Venustampulla echinocandica]RDL36331.1 hypothetical protein BP5553_05683 [Venustampulla echinocandica]
MSDDPISDFDSIVLETPTRKVAKRKIGDATSNYEASVAAFEECNHDLLAISKELLDSKDIVTNDFDRLRAAADRKSHADIWRQKMSQKMSKLQNNLAQAQIELDKVTPYQKRVNPDSNPPRELVEDALAIVVSSHKSLDPARGLDDKVRNMLFNVEVEHLQQEVDRLQEKCANFQNQSQIRRTETGNELSRLRSENDEFSAELVKMRDERDKHRNDSNSLMAERDVHKQAMKKKQSEVNELLASNKALDGLISKADREKETLRNQVQNLKSEYRTAFEKIKKDHLEKLEKAKTSLEQERMHHDRLKTVTAEREREVESLKIELTTVNEQLETAQSTRDAEVRRFKAKTEKLNESLEQEKLNLAEKTAEASKLRNELNEMTEQISQLKKDLKDETAKASHLHADLKDEIARSSQLQTALDDESAKSIRLQTDLDRAWSKIKDETAKASHLHADLKDETARSSQLQTALDDESAKSIRLQTDLDRAWSKIKDETAKASYLQVNLKYETARSNQLQTDLDETKQLHSATLEKIKVARVLERNEATKLKESLELLLANEHAALDMAVRNNSQLGIQLSTLRSEYASATARLNAAQQIIPQQDSQLNIATEKIRALETRVAEETRKSEETAARLESAQHQIHEKDSKLSTAARDIKALETNVSEQKVTSDAVEKELQSAKKQMRQNDAEIVTLRLAVSNETRRSTTNEQNARRQMRFLIRAGVTEVDDVAANEIAGHMMSWTGQQIEILNIHLDHQVWDVAVEDDSNYKNDYSKSTAFANLARLYTVIGRPDEFHETWIPCMLLSHVVKMLVVSCDIFDIILAARCVIKYLDQAPISSPRGVMYLMGMIQLNLIILARCPRIWQAIDTDQNRVAESFKARIQSETDFFCKCLPLVTLNVGLWEAQLAASYQDDVTFTSGCYLVSNEETKWVLIANVDNKFIHLVDINLLERSSKEPLADNVTYILAREFLRPELILKHLWNSDEARWWNRCIIPMAAVDSTMRELQARIEAGEDLFGLWP